MNYFYGAIFLISGLILLISMRKESKMFIYLGGYFLILGGWWIANELTPTINLFAGVPGWILRGIGAAALIMIGIFYYRNVYKKNK